MEDARWYFACLHWCGSPLCGPGRFQPKRDPDQLAVLHVSVPIVSIYRSGSVYQRPPRGVFKSLFQRGPTWNHLSSLGHRNSGCNCRLVGYYYRNLPGERVATLDLGEGLTLTMLAASCTSDETLLFPSDQSHPYFSDLPRAAFHSDRELAANDRNHLDRIDL